jgi:hypothetical protein
MLTEAEVLLVSELVENPTDSFNNGFEIVLEGLADRYRRLVDPGQPLNLFAAAPAEERLLRLYIRDFVTYYLRSNHVLGENRAHLEIREITVCERKEDSLG